MPTIVIDTNVLMSASKDPFNISKIKDQGDIAREFLEQFRDLNNHYYMVVTPELEKEYRKYVDYPDTVYGAFGTNWRVQMQSLNRVVRLRNSVVDSKLRSLIINSTSDKDFAQVMLDDVHLIEAAKVPEADKIIVSFEKRCRNAFAETSHIIDVLKIIVWVDPEIEDEKPLEWLKNGARPEKGRRLGISSFKS